MIRQDILRVLFVFTYLKSTLRDFRLLSCLLHAIIRAPFAATLPFAPILDQGNQFITIGSSNS